MCNRYIAILFLYSILITPLFAQDNQNLSYTEFNDDERLEEMYKKGLDIVVEKPDKADSIARVMLDVSNKDQVLYKGLAHYLIGEKHYYRENYDLALRCYNKALAYVELTDDSLRLAGIYSNIGLMYDKKADYKAALDYYEKCYDLELQLNDSSGMVISLQNMGLIMDHFGKDELRDLYFSKALKLCKEFGDKRSIADISLNLGVSYVFKQEMDKGYKYYLDALEVYKQIGDSNRIAIVKNNIGCYYMKVKQYDKAYEYLTEAISIFTTIDKKSGLIDSYKGMGDLYALKGDHWKAIEMYKKCEDLNKEVGLLDTQSENLLSLYKTYKKMGDVENALRVFEQYHTIKDSIYTIEQFDKILEYENRFSLQSSENQIAKLKAKNRLYTIFFLIVAFAVLSGGVFLFFYTRDRGMKEKQRLLSLEQKVLRTQMNPHFIFNSLSAIQCYILENKVMDAVDFLADFASLMRMVLHYSQEEYITLEQEREILDFYIDLQNKRFGDKVKYQIIIDEKLEKSKVKIPPMLAQPFIENSFEHGELYKKEDGNIIVRFEKKGKNISYQIEDNGIGISSKIMESNSPTAKKHKSLALKITKERLKLMNNNHIGKKVNLLVEDRAKYGTNGTRVEFTIPLQEMN